MAKKKGCNRTVVKELVSISFAMRRQDIRESSYHIKDVLKKYPFFKEQEFVSVWVFLGFVFIIFMYLGQFFFEVEKITGIDRLRATVRESWKSTWSTKILLQAGLETSSNLRLRQLMARYPSKSISEHRCHDVLFCLTILYTTTKWDNKLHKNIVAI